MVINQYLIQDLVDLKLWNKDMKDKLIYYNGSIQLIDEIPDKIKRLHELKDTAIEMEFNLRRGNLRKFGELIFEGWKKKKKFNPLTTNTYIDSLINNSNIVINRNLCINII